MEEIGEGRTVLAYMKQHRNGGGPAMPVEAIEKLARDAITMERLLHMKVWGGVPRCSKCDGPGDWDPDLLEVWCVDRCHRITLWRGEDEVTDAK